MSSLHLLSTGCLIFTFGKYPHAFKQCLGTKFTNIEDIFEKNIRLSYSLFILMTMYDKIMTIGPKKFISSICFFWIIQEYKLKEEEKIKTQNFGDISEHWNSASVHFKINPCCYCMIFNVFHADVLDFLGVNVHSNLYSKDPC